MKSIIKKILILPLVMVLTMTVFVESAYAGIRIKEIAHFKGARDNQLIGYGIVVGLAGSGDKGKSIFTTKAIASLLTRMGIKMDANDISMKNTAAVMVTATLPPFIQGGAKIDVTLSSIGDAKSLAGGMLLQTPLQGSDGQVYAVAQGAVSIGGMSLEDVGAGFTTVGNIPGGALIERAVPVTMIRSGGFLDLLLDKVDFTTCSRVAEAINLDFGQVIAHAVDAGTIEVQLPPAFAGDVVKFVSKIERITVIPDYKAKIIINERTGTIVAGSEVKISNVSLNFKNISIDIEPSQEKAKATSPQASRAVESLPIYNDAFFQEGVSKKQAEKQGEISIGELTRYLSTLGVSPQDLVSIISTIRATGAIQADVVII